MRIAIASDHGGYTYKKALINELKKSHIIIDSGCDNQESCDYPDFAEKACLEVVNGTADRAILICGTGIGMSISANKIQGIRCALVNRVEEAIITREHNDSNVLAMGERVISLENCLTIANAWLATDFSHNKRHEIRIKKVKELETKYE